MKPTLIDTDILSYFLKGNQKVEANFQEYLSENESINISIITYYEILSGLTFSRATKQLLQFEKFAESCNILNLSEHSIQISSEIYSNQRVKGLSIDDIDILIAGVAIANDLVLVTNNTKHFGKIDSLVLNNWAI